MNKRIIYVLIGIIVAAALAIGGYFILNNNNNMSSNSSNTTTQSSVPGMVTIQSYAFSPSTVTVNKGDTVTWLNKDSVTHRIVANDGSFDLGDQASGSSVKFTFTKSGTFNYYCSIHPSMKGVVIVK